MHARDIKRFAGERLGVSCSALVPQMLCFFSGRVFPVAMHTTAAVSTCLARLKAGDRLGEGKHTYLTKRCRHASTDAVLSCLYGTTAA